MAVQPLRSMRRAGGFCALLTCVSLVLLHTASVASDPAEPVETPWEDVQPVVEDGVADHDSLQALVHALPSNVEIRRHIVGDNGTVTGQPAAADESTLIYSNTLGQVVFGSYSAGLRFADDITTVGVPGCNLDRYEFLVSGDANGDGSGSGPFSVDFALYDGCPGGGASVIAGTEGRADLPDEGYHLIVFQVPTDVEASLPCRFWLQVAFSREHAGVVVGAPAQIGYSMDRFDYPGFHCIAGLGHFPESPHASFHIEVYARGACANSFVGYQNTNEAGNAWSAGSRVYFADDIEQAVRDCRMVAYEIVHKGNGFVRVDLRTHLDDADPAIGGLIEGTRMDCLSSGDIPQICRGEFDPPIPIPRDLWVVFKSNSGVMGPILTCQEPGPGQSDLGHMVYSYDDQWELQDFGGICGKGGFSVIVYCEGMPPAGACCDMHIRDDDGEAVCREVAEMNCPFNRWLEDEACDPDPFDPPCGLSACCTPDDTCENLTRNECEALVEPGEPIIWQQDEYCGEGDQDCPYYACLGEEGDCNLARETTGCWYRECCDAVCAFDRWCCLVAWDEPCVRWSQVLCRGDTAPFNNSCYDPDRGYSPLAVEANSRSTFGLGEAYGSDDPPFCCYKDPPGMWPQLPGLWFTFEATHSSARIHTCGSLSSSDDSVIQLFLAIDDTSLETACNSLDLIACNDDASGCGSGLHADLCVDTLQPGQTYYVQLGVPWNEDSERVYELAVESPCTPDEPLVPNDYCVAAVPIHEGDTSFDLANATLDCPTDELADCVEGRLQADLWYDYRPQHTGPVMMQAFSSTDSLLAPDVHIVVYKDGECPPMAGTPLACSWAVEFDPPFGVVSILNFAAVARESYIVRLVSPMDMRPSGTLQILNVAGCPVGDVVWLDPPSGVVDARRPHPIGDSTTLEGIDTLTVFMPDGAVTTCLGLSETSLNPLLHPPYESDAEVNDIVSLEDNGFGIFTIRLARPITPGEVTALTYSDNDGIASTGCFIAHPANVNADSTAGPADILAIIDIINGVQTSQWGAYSSDIDHSGVTGPPDILRVIDLLNAGWLNTTLPTKPGTCP